MYFREFEKADRSADPKLVETISWHAVNGKRLKSSVDFFNDPDCAWSVKLLSVSMEATRFLIWFWLSCIGASLLAGERPMLYKVLDPRCSPVVMALQHLSSMCMSLEGGGRLQLLWPSSMFNSFSEFCELQPDKCRRIRRMLLLAAGWIFRRHFTYLNSDVFSLLMCGDEEAHDESLKTFLEFWTVKHQCCYPPGLCRDLKAQALTPEDLTSANCKRLFFWLAGTLQLSIADVESMHSQNRVFQGSRFSSVSSKFVNAEAIRVRDESRKLQFGKSCQPQDGKSMVLRKDCVGLKVSWKNKSPTPKGASALELFRKHYLKVSSIGGTVNPCSKEVWSAVREAFANLSSREKTLYEQMSEQSRAQAFSKRLVKKEHVKQKQLEKPSKKMDDPNSAALIPHQSAAVHLQILPLSEALDIVHQAGENCLGQIVDRFAQRSGSCAKSDHPISEATLEKVWRSQLSSGIDGKTACKTFRSQAESVARPENQDEVFPARVVHEGFCGEQCRHHAQPSRIAIHCNTLALFNYIVDMILGSCGYGKFYDYVMLP